MTEIAITLNGRERTASIEDRMLLVDLLRDEMGLTGTHVGCDTSQCGACTVSLNGRAVKSCTVLAVMADGAEVLTIEGLAKGEALHPLQEAFSRHHALQCGFCTPGMIMASLEMIDRHGDALDAETVRSQLEGNICRCTGYHNIVKAILDAAGALPGRVAEAEQA